ncbi:MAG: hypothetical protein ACOY0T_05575 [Myxococcota bacterium]
MIRKLFGCVLVVSACAENPPAAAPPTAEAAPATTASAAPRRDGPPPTCPNGTRPAADGLVDDFESADGALPALAGRQPSWRLDVAEHAKVSLPGKNLAAEAGGHEGSKRAMHFAGQTANEDMWGADLSLSLLKSGFYDASKYAGVAFKIRSEKPNFNPRFKITDANSDPEGGLCKVQCWNSFGKELIVGPEWQHVELMWSDLKQQPDWGDVRPPTITQSKIKALQWSIYSGQAFDIWIDDIRFLECK